MSNFSANFSKAYWLTFLVPLILVLATIVIPSLYGVIISDDGLLFAHIAVIAIYLTWFLVL